MVLTLQMLQDAVLARLDGSMVSAPALTLVASAVLATTALVWLTRSSGKTKDSHAREPERMPTTKPFFADTFDLVAHMDDIHDYMTQWALHFRGKPFKFHMVGLPDINVLYTPQHFEDVLKADFESFPKGKYMIDNMREVLGHGIFAVDGKPWFHQRKVASHMFTMRAMRDSMAVAVTKHLAPLTRVFAKAERAGEPMDLFKVFNRFTMEAFAEIGFGVEMDALEREEDHPLHRALDEVQQVIVFRFMRPIWFWKLQRWLNVGAEAQMKRAVATLDESVLEIVTKALERRANPQAGPASGEKKSEFHDIVSLFLDHVDTMDASERGDIEFNAAFFRDVVMNFLFAGRDTTAQALSWLYVELSSHPEVEKKIRDEITRVLPSLSNGTSSTPAIEELSQLVYLEAVIRETLRLHPPIPINSKYVSRDTVLSDGTLVREGSTVSIAAYVMARMPFVWGEDAAEFKPERWIDSEKGRLIAVSQFKFITFNAGPRLCLGINLAMMEMKMVLATLFSKFHVELVPGQNVTYVNSVSLPIKGKLLVRVHDAPL